LIADNKESRNNFYFPSDIQKLFIQKNDNIEPNLLSLFHFNAIVEENRNKTKGNNKNGDKR
jgi:hypothetical protein